MIFLLLFFAVLKDECQGACSVRSCSKEFTARTKGLPEHDSSRPFCLFLREYANCLTDQEKACYGDIFYHALKSTLKADQQNNDKCTGILSQESTLGVSDEDFILNAAKVNSKPDPCGYESNNETALAHCGMFGDPHLKIFNGTFMTCRVKGAWPLLSSSHLAIQVTNEPVGPDHKATATTKVTVLIKGKEGCSSAKTYEASSDSIPKAFVDGTTWSGPDPSHPSVWVKEALPSSYVLIHIRHINSTVGIRRLGRYLTVFATLPQKIVEASRLNSTDLQLCDQGCPITEQLRGNVQQNFSPAMTQEEALAKCKATNLTDYFLDSCVFDLVTTGDVTFREAARLAQMDMLTSDPRNAYKFVTNCTDWPCIWKASGACFLASRTLWEYVLGWVLVQSLFNIFFRLGF